MTDCDRKDILETAFNVEDFQGLGRRKLWRLISIFLSEFFGTAVLVFLLCSTVQGAIFNHAQQHLVIGTTAGFAVATSVMLFGHISGSHINPALSLAAVILSEISLPMCLFYTIAQCSGATFGYSLTRAILPESATEGKNITEYASHCCSVPDSGLENSQVVLVEIIGTTILGWAFCSALDKRNLNKHDSLPLKFGVVIIALALPLALYSGCSVNPARTFGPAFYHLYWQQHWIYWIGPCLGGVFAAVTYRLFFDPSKTEITSNSTRRDPATINLRNNSHKSDEEA